MRVFRVLWPLISLPMMLSFCYVYNTTRSFGSTMWRSAAKCGATFVAVITAVLGIVLFNRPANAWLLALALLFCCIADFVIERDFRFGVKKRRMYECVVWGGVAASVIGIVSLILLAVSGSGIFYGVREMVFKGRYDVFFSGDDRLIALIPDNLGLRMFLIYTGVILAGLVITIIVRLISWRKTQPHKF